VSDSFRADLRLLIASDKAAYRRQIRETRSSDYRAPLSLWTTVTWQFHGCRRLPLDEIGGEPPAMLFIKRAKILSTRLYEFFEGGDIDAIATSPDKLCSSDQSSCLFRFAEIRHSSGFQRGRSPYAYIIAMTAVTPKADILGWLAITGEQSNLRLLSLQAVEVVHTRTAKANRRARP